MISEFTASGVATEGRRYDTRAPLRWVFSHIRHHPFLAAGAVVCSITAWSLFGLGPVMVARVAQVVIDGGAGAALVAASAALLAVLAGDSICALCSSLCAVTLGHRLERDARDELYRSLLGKSQTYHNRQRVGDLVARATDDIRHLNQMVHPGLMFMSDMVLGFVAPLTYVALLDPRLLIVPGLFAVAFVFTVRDYTRRLGPVMMEQRVQYGQVTATTEEAVSGIELVKAAVRETWERKRFHAGAALFRDLFVRQGRIEALYVPMLMFGVAVALSLLHGIVLLRAGGIELSELIALVGLMHLLRIPAFMSAFSFAMVQTGIAGARRILAVLTASTELDQNTGGRRAAVHGAIAFEGVSFGYQDAQSALTDIDVRIEAGETVAIVGQNRRRQDHAHATGQPHLRPRRGQDHRRRGRPARLEPDQPALADRQHRAGRVPVLAHRRREHRLRPPRRQPAGHRSRRPRRRRARLHYRLSGRLRHRHRRARRHPVRRPAAAARPGARVPERSAHPDSGRLHQRHRQQDRGRDPARPAYRAARAHHADHHPPPVADPLGGPHPGAGRGAAGGGRHARRAARHLHRVPAHLQPLRHRAAAVAGRGGGGRGGGRLMAFIMDGIGAEEYDRTYSDRELVRRIFAYFRTEGRRMLIVSAAVAASSVFGAAFPAVMSRAIDQVADTATSMSVIVAIVVAIALLNTANWALNAVRRVLGSRAIGNVVLRMRRDAFDALMRHDLSFYDRYPTGKIVSRVTADTQAFSEVVTLSMEVVSQTVLVLLIFVYLATVDPVLTLVTLVLVPLVIGVALAFRRIARDVVTQSRRAVADVSAHVHETVSGIGIAKSFRKEQTLYDQFGDVNRQSFRLNWRAGIVFSSIFPVLFLLAGFGNATLAYTGGLRAAGGGLTTGEWYLFLQAVGLMWFPLTSIASFWSQFQLGLAAGERVFALLDTEPQVVQTGSEPVSNLAGAVELRNVSFPLQGRRDGVRGLLVRRGAGRDGGAGGPYRLRQVQHHQAGGALLRVPEGPDPGGRPRHPLARPGQLPIPPRLRDPGAVPVQRQCARQCPLSAGATRATRK